MSSNVASGTSLSTQPTANLEGESIQSESIDATPTANPSVQSEDPFANQREANNDPFAGDKLGDLSGSNDMAMSSSPPSKDRRMSKEWDASKVPPSRFQRREGSIYSTPSSRDSHVKGATRDQAYHDKLKEKGWSK